MLKQLKKFLNNNDVALLFASTIIVNAGNYAINLLLGRFLGPEQYAEAGAMATFVLILSFLAVGLQLSAAKFSAVYFGNDTINQFLAFKNWIFKKSKYLSLIIIVLLLLSVNAISNYLHFKSVIPLTLIFIGIPAYFHMSISRGLLQGSNKFSDLALTYQVEMWVRLFVTFLVLYIVFLQELPYASEAIGIGFLSSFLLSYIIAKKSNSSLTKNLESQLNKEEKNTSKYSIQFLEKNEFYRFALVIAAYEFSQILINNSDVLLVKHYFTNDIAGLYAAIALIGRVVFFATWTIVTLLFPKVIQMEQKGLNHRPLFWKSLGFVFAIGASITIACYLFDDFIINLLFGSAYLEAASLLWLYAIATTLFACANVFAYYFMSLNKYIPVYLSVIIGISQIIGISIFHNSIESVIYVQIVLMSLLFVAMSIYFFTPKTKAS